VTIGANGHRERKPAQATTVSHFTKPPLAAALLCGRHGDLGAREIALKEQRRAKRARSKRRFAFWAEVAMQISSGD
jgi:hypothetical protein